MSDYLDEEGYPTEEALDMIASWNHKDIQGWFDFIRSLWALTEWKTEEVSVGYGDRMVTRYTFGTGGWSGNEDLIGAMMRNKVVWLVTWVQSRRGGHYIFEDPRYTWS